MNLYALGLLVIACGGCQHVEQYNKEQEDKLRINDAVRSGKIEELTTSELLQYYEYPELESEFEERRNQVMAELESGEIAVSNLEELIALTQPSATEMFAEEIARIIVIKIGNDVGNEDILCELDGESHKAKSIITALSNGEAKFRDMLNEEFRVIIYYCKERDPYIVFVAGSYFHVGGRGVYLSSENIGRLIESMIIGENGSE
jgi:hypothetical protein